MTAARMLSSLPHCGWTIRSNRYRRDDPPDRAVGRSAVSAVPASAGLQEWHSPVLR